MKWIVLVLALSGCAQLPANSIDVMTMLKADVSHRVQSFNALRGVNMPVPEVEFENLGDADGQEEFGVIEINYTICAADIEDCLDDTVPHELAHEAVDVFGQIGTFRTFSNGHVIVHHESTDGSHGAQWCDAMRAFGGVPEKHGYCH